MNHPNEHAERLATALRMLLNDYSDLHGDGICDCRPEPENENYVCSLCAAQHALACWDEYIIAATNATESARAEPGLAEGIAITLDAVVRAEWGERCPEYEPGCTVCAAWYLRDAKGRAPSYDEVVAECEASLEADFEDQQAESDRAFEQAWIGGDPVRRSSL